MAEVLHNNLPEIEASDIHTRLGLEKGKYILLSAHREENRWSSESNGESLLSGIAESRQRKAIANIDTEKNRRTKQAQSQACLSYALQGGGNAKRNFLSLMAA